jgi:hypothetical protein
MRRASSAPLAVRMLLGGVIAAALAGGVYLVWVVVDVITYPGATEDPRDYAALRRRWQSGGLVDHFPRTIPPAATDVRLHYEPSFAQSPNVLQLRVVLPVAERDRVTQEASAWPKVEYPFTATNYTAKPRGAFEREFDVYVRRASTRSKPEWNHGESAGVAISRTTGEVVYWAQSW